MKNVKKFAALLLALIMVLSLVACGGSSSSSSSEESTEGTDAAVENTGETYTIRIGHSDTTSNLIHVNLERFAAATVRLRSSSLLPSSSVPMPR